MRRHFTAITRIGRDPGSKAYLKKRLAEGRTRRCMKRYLARHPYRTLNTLKEHAPKNAVASGSTLAPTVG